MAVGIGMQRARQPLAERIQFLTRHRENRVERGKRARETAQLISQPVEIAPQATR
jgi:hypothetical protein